MSEYTKNLRDGKLIIREGSPVWEAVKTYTAGNYVRPVTRNGFIYECTTGGTSGESAPTWPTAAESTVEDGTVTWTCRVPEELEVPFIDEGGLSWKEAHNYIVQKDRGQLKGRRPGDEEECQVTISAKYTVFQSESGDSKPSPVDCFKKRGAAASWNSSRPGYEPHAVDVIAKVLHEDKNKYEVITFPDVSASSVEVEEGDENNTLSLEGGALAIEPSITWEAVS